MLIKLFIISLIRSLLVMSWFMAAVPRRKRYADVSTGERSYVQCCYGDITVLYYWKENTCCNYSLYDPTWKSIERKGK